MAFEYRFNVIRFYSKLNRFVLSPRKKPNHFVLKIRPGGFADYTEKINFPLWENLFSIGGNKIFNRWKQMFPGHETEVSYA